MSFKIIMAAMGWLALACGSSSAQGAPPAQQPLSAADATSRTAIAQFVKQVASMHGAVSVCDKNEAELVRSCALLILDNWHTVSGLAAEPERAFRVEIGSMWEALSGNAAKEQTVDKPNSCEHVIAMERASRIWEVCRRPGASGAAPAPAPSRVPGSIQIR